MDLDPADGQLPSRRIADAVRALINNGELAPGDKLPSERELARRFGTARNTAREAIRLLSEEGLVTAQHGRGVFVREKQRLLRRDTERYSQRTYRATTLTPFRLEMAREGKTARVEVTSIEQVIPPFDIADRLKTSPDEPSVLRRCNTYYADDEPLARRRRNPVITAQDRTRRHLRPAGRTRPHHGQRPRRNHRPDGQAR